MNRRNNSSSRASGRQTCLVVEDSKFDQERISRILARSFQELDVSVAANLEQARAAMDEHMLALILLDNNLPDGNGATFAVELSEDPRYQDIPVIMVSDWPTPFMFHKAEIAGVLHVVNKSDFGARYIHSALQRPRTKPRSRLM